MSHFDLTGTPLARRIRTLQLVGLVGVVSMGLTMTVAIWVFLVTPVTRGVSGATIESAGVAAVISAVALYFLYHLVPASREHGVFLVVDSSGFSLRLRSGRDERYGWNDAGLAVRVVEISGPHVLERPWIELLTPKRSPTPLTRGARDALVASAMGAGVELSQTTLESHGAVQQTISFRRAARPIQSM